MNELFKNDITIRTVSLLLAILLWFFVLDSSANPFTTKFVTVSLKIINEDFLETHGLGIKDKNFQKSIVVSVKGRTNIVNRLRPDDIEATLDFSKVREPGEKEIPIDGPYTAVQGISIEDAKQKTIGVSVEKIVKNAYKVEPLLEGTLKAGYKITKMTVVPETIEIQGLESMVKAVSSIKTAVDINNLDRDTSIKKEYKVYNKSGAEIPELSKNLGIDIKLEVAKEVPINPSIKGRPAKNHTEGIRRVFPEKALITGDPEVVAKIGELVTDTIDIENLSDSINMVRQIKLPEGVKLVNTPQDVTVSISIIKPSRRDISVNKETISLINADTTNTYKYEILTKSVAVGMIGVQSDLDKIDLASLSPSADVAKLAEGTHKLDLKLVVPSNISLAEEYKIEVKIEKEQKPPEQKSDKDTKQDPKQDKS